MTPDQIYRAMRRAIEVARQSKSEDDRHHPKVGAILTDSDGNEILSKCRGESGPGTHAEFALLAEAANRGLDLSDMHLFVTLEPCSRRSPSKVPCAVRVAHSGINNVYVGTLDPNPQIIGRGVNFLISQGVNVEHFPAPLRREIIEMNATFQGTHAFLVDPIVPYILDGSIRARQRAGILTTTLDIIASAKGDVKIFTGDTSWLRDLFVGLLEANLRGVPIKMIAQKPLPTNARNHAGAIGVQIKDCMVDHGIRATLTMKDGVPNNMIVVDKSPERHAHIYSAPHDSTMLGLLSMLFDQQFDESITERTSPAQLVPIPLDQVAEALRTTVFAYRDASFSLENVDLGRIQWLTNDVEIFKLRRAAATVRIMQSKKVTAPIHISGTPWGFFPPVIELDKHGAYVLIDGVHRVHVASVAQEQTIRALVVRGVNAELPATPICCPTPRIVEAKRPRESRYSDYDHALFRPIRDALEHGEWTR